MSYHVRPATTEDMDALLNIYAEARRYMRAQGNDQQWSDDYPGTSDILGDIEQEALNVVADEQETPVACFSVFGGPDPTYTHIDGAWKNDKDYIVVHRVAVGLPRKGLGRQIIQMLKGAREDIRIDTHELNTAMRSLLESQGFAYCGTIYLENGDPRRAYHWVYED